MPEPVLPGVPVEELGSTPPPISGVASGIAGFVGVTEKGPTAPTLVTSQADFDQVFGGVTDQLPFTSPYWRLPYAVRGLFIDHRHPSGAGPLDRRIAAREAEQLALKGVNAVRDFRPSGRGVRVWGARTMSSDPAWKYVHLRRLLLFLEHSIDRGIGWVAFELNAEPTWAAVRAAVSAFLVARWRAGAFPGARPSEAFYVRCDRSTMTQDDIDTGRLVCEVGVAPLRPAEFVIFRIGQWTEEHR